MTQATVTIHSSSGRLPVPFSAERLDRFLDEARIDILLATSKHSVQYLLGGHRSTFFSHKEGLGESRYLPIFIYVTGRADQAAYVGSQLEAHQHKIAPFWTPTATVRSVGTLDAVAEAVAYVRSIGLSPMRVGIESSYLPHDAAQAVGSAFPDAELIDAFTPLERLRSIKTSGEIELLRAASQKVIDSMVATFAKSGEGMTKSQIVDILIGEETRRGLNYEYCFITIGCDLNRAISGQQLRRGDIVSLDSGGNEAGYIGDLVRMGVAAPPDQELVDILGEVEAVQQAAFGAVRPGATGRDIYEIAEGRLASTSIASCSHFLAHGIGLVQHEMPRLTNRGSIAYKGTHIDSPLEEHMCISVETTCLHPRRGLIKLEDTLAVTGTGSELLGEGARGWNMIGG